MYPDTSGYCWLNTRGDKNCRVRLPSDVEFLPTDSTAIFQTRKGYWYMLNSMEFNPANQFTSPDHYPKKAKLVTWDYGGDSLILMLTDSGIVSINRENKITRYTLNYPTPLLTIDLYCDKNLGLWICKPHGGVYYYEKTNEGYRLYDIFLKDEYVTSTFRDIEGNVWFSIHGGGVKMMPWNFKTIRSYSKEDGLQDNEVYSICVDSKNRIWLGHKYGLIDCVDNGKIFHLRLPQASNKLGRIMKISEHPGGYIAFGGDDGMCFLKMNGPINKLTPVYFSFNEYQSTFSQPVKDFSFNNSGDVFIVSQEGIQFIANKDIVSDHFITTALPLPRKRYYTLCFDINQDIYYSDFDGLMKIKNKTSYSLIEKDSLLKKHIVSMCEYKGNIILAVLGYGLVVMKDNSVIRHITNMDGLLSNHCSRLIAAGDKVLVCTNKGLNILLLQANGSYKIEQVTPAEGLISSQVNDAYEKNNTIFASTLKGVSVIHLDQNIRQQQQPLIYFTNITWQGKDITTAINPEISYIDKYLRFDYISPYFTYPEGVVYQYCLNNGEWISTPNTTLEFNSLRPGDYTLLIRTKNLNSEWSKAISFSFIILQPYYKTIWFYFIIFLILIAAVIITYALRIRRIRKEQAIKLSYEQNINLLRTQALQAMVNPHFIFNSLSAIQQQINVGDSVKAGSYLSRFAKLLRMNLETINENYISLAKELERINLYLESEKMRLEEKLDYKIVIGKSLHPESILIPSMILQPLIENAIWHGLMPKGFGIVKIEIEDLNDFLSIQIVDDGIGINQSQINASKNNGRRQFGLNITRERLTILEKKLGKPITFSITDLSIEGLSGTRISILLPLISEN